MIKELKLTKKRKMLGAAVICVALITGLAMLWQMGQVAEATILDPHPGLVGWWRFDEVVGSLTKDSSGYGNHGMVYGATPVDGKYGKALSFDGTDDYVNVPPSESFNVANEITVEAWVKRAAVLPFDMVIWRKSSDHFLCVRANNNKPEFDLFIDGSWRVCASLHSIDTEWHHIVGTYSSSTDKTLRLYVDDVLERSVPLTGLTTYKIRQTLSAARIGNAFDNRYTEGVIDEVRIYNRVLSAAEIDTLFQKEPDFSSRLLAKVPKGTNQFIVTLSWQGVGSINITTESPSKIYTEENVSSVYQKTSYSSSNGDMLNIKRLAVSVTALSSDENWYLKLEFNGVEDYRITVEVEK